MHEKVNPKWRAWFDQQSPAVQAAVEAKWEETASDPDMAQARALGGEPNHARLFKLLSYCAETYGYDFT